jgi:hypothetical protein
MPIVIYNPKDIECNLFRNFKFILLAHTLDFELSISNLKKNVIFKGHVFYLFSCIQGALQN